MIRVGMVGLGKMGLSHYAILNAHPDVKVVAVCDASKFILGMLGKHSDVQRFTDYRKMLERCELECVMISTPTSSHGEIVRAAMERNIHVFVEKPFCLSPQEGQELVKIADERNLVNQVGYVNRFNAVFDKTKYLVSAGVIGEVYHFLAEMYGQVVVKDKKSNWRGKRSEGGGCLYEYGAHCIDLINFMLGPPSEVAGVVLKQIYSQNVEDAVFATFIYDNGTTGQVAVNWADETFRKATNRMSLWGMEGKIIVDKQECRVYLKNPEKMDGLEGGWNILYNTDLAKPVGFFLRGEEYSIQLDHFVACIKDRSIANRSSFASALETDILIDRIASSRQEGS